MSILLGGVAVTLIKRNRAMLIGRAMNDRDRDKILSHLRTDPVVRSVFDAKTEEIGPGVYRWVLLTAVVPESGIS